MNTQQHNSSGCLHQPCSGHSGLLTDVETELRKMHSQLKQAGVVNGARVMELAASIVAASAKQAIALRDAETLIGEIMRDEVNAQDECEKWLRAYGQNAAGQAATKGKD